MSLGLVVEVHSHGLESWRIDHLLASVAWSDSVSPPWGGITLTVKEGFHGLGTGNIPAAGDWVVLREKEGGPALQWGHVPDWGVTLTASGPSGALTAEPATVQVETWLMFLRRVQVYAALGTRGGQSLGTLFGREYWNSVAKALIQTMAPKVKGVPVPVGIGSALAAVVRAIAKAIVPASLGGESLSDVVRVAWDDATALQWCGDPKHERQGTAGRGVPVIKGLSLSGLSTLMSGFGGTTALDMIQGTFSADPMMMEMFPSLEDPGTGEAIAPVSMLGNPDKFMRAMQDSTLADDPGAGHLTVNKEFKFPTDPDLVNTTPAAPPATTDALPSKTAKILKRNPVLIYRMRPWQVEPMSVFAARLRETGVRHLDPTLFEIPTWNAGLAIDVPADDIESLHIAQSDEERVNVTTIGMSFLGDNAAKFFESAGLPIYLAPSHTTGYRTPMPVEVEGARVFAINWPFLPPVDKVNKIARGRWFAHMHTVALLGYHFMQTSSRRFATGGASCRQRLDIRSGEIIRFHVGDGYRPLTAYVEMVQHSRSLNGAAVDARTEVTYSRGLFDESTRTAIGTEGYKVSL